MEEEGLGSWLGLATGCAHSHGHGEQRPSILQLDAPFPQHDKEQRGCDRDQRAVSKKGGKGAKQRVKIGGDGRSSQGPCPSNSGSGARKKLRLTKVQSTLLENSFRAHNILSHAQKQELARQLNLSSRQVEVWFQNRRARTKLKQTEVDCEFLKRCCEILTDENRRLKHEIVELQRSAEAGSQLHGAAAVVKFCPSCEKVTVNN